MANAEPPDIRLPSQVAESDLPEGADPFAPENTDPVDTTIAQPELPPEAAREPLTDVLLVVVLVLLVLLALTSIRLLKLREVLRRGRAAVMSARDETRQLRRMLSDVEDKAEARIRRRTGRLLDRSQQTQRERDELDLANQRLKGLIRSDTLTGLANSRYFQYRLETELRRALRSRQLVAVILCDIDGFESYNRKHGHDKGDLLLVSVARLIAKHFRRGGDITARLDADRFAILAPDTNFEDAVQQAMRLHRQIRRLDTEEFERKIEERVTSSIGVICVSPTRLHPPRIVMERARRALKLAKDRGRDRVAGDPGMPTERSRPQQKTAAEQRRKPPAAPSERKPQSPGKQIAKEKKQHAGTARPSRKTPVSGQS